MMILCFPFSYGFPDSSGVVALREWVLGSRGWRLGLVGDIRVGEDWSCGLLMDFVPLKNFLMDGWSGITGCWQKQLTTASSIQVWGRSSSLTQCHLWFLATLDQTAISAVHEWLFQCFSGAIANSLFICLAAETTSLLAQVMLLKLHPLCRSSRAQCRAWELPFPIWHSFRLGVSDPLLLQPGTSEVRFCCQFLLCTPEDCM